jgi:Cd2+/Zn2+-exporting ATPase
MTSPTHPAAPENPAPKRRFPRVAQREPELHEDAESEWKHQLAASFACLCFALLGWAFAPGNDGPLSWGALGCYVLAYLAGGYHTALETWERLVEGALDVHFLMLAVAAGAAAIGKWGEGSTLLFLFSFSGALEHYAMERTQHEIRSLFHSAPKTATVLEAAGERVVPVEGLTPGMRLLIKPGELFPVDAEIAKGETASDESNLTGEATPVSKAEGDPVYAGTLNLWGVVEALVSRPPQESALQKIIRLIQSAQRNKAPAQRLTDKFGTAYTYGILVLTALMFLLWWMVWGHAPFVSEPGRPSAFYHAMTLLVVASPCALVLSIPSAVLAAIARAARGGILFRGGAAVEQLAEIQVVAMDKTGTLTTGELRVEKVESFPAGREQEVTALAYSLDRHSNHPLARAVTRYGKRNRISPLALEEFQSATGHGMQARFEGKPVRLGRRDWVSEKAASVAAAQKSDGVGVSEVWLSWGDLLGRMVLRDDVRPEARALVESLRRLGLRSVVLTGDRQSAADHLRTELGLDDVRGEMKPDQKLATIEELMRGGQKVAMIGDGVNDAPSIAAAHVGVAMGARGSDAALEQAAVVLMNDRLENFLAAYELSRMARRIIRQNVAISLGVIVLLVALALMEKIKLTHGVFGHEGSTLLVVSNSLRLLFAGSKPRPNRTDA